MCRKFFLSVYVWMAVVFFCKAQVNPFANINSSFDEQNPVLSPDGQTLYFTRSNHPNNVGGERDTGDIWYSQLSPSGWLTPQRVRNLNSYDWNGVIGFVGDQILLHNHYATGSLLKTQGISKSTMKGGEWTEPSNISIPYFKNHSKYFGGSISDSGDALVFSLESYDSKGAEDIYISVNKDGQWSEPKNLGNVINTRFQELTPFIYKDSLLYFASNGHNGKGSTDIFVCKREGDSWYNWSAPQNVEVVNTEGRELAYRQYKGFAIYTSTVNSDGYGDVKLYTEADVDTLFNNKALEPEEKIELLEVAAEDIPANSIMLYGTVSSKKDGAPLEPVIDVKAVGKVLGNIKTNTEGSLYMANLKSPGTYLVTVAAPGYISQQENIELASAEAKKLQMNFELQPIVVGARVNLENVLFKQSKAEIIESSYSELDLVVDLMKQYPSMKIRLEGHTDNRGVAKHNLRLSKQRVEAVEDYLVSKGISSRRVKGKGYGGSRPIANNEDPELRRLNRRVEFTIIKE